MPALAIDPKNGAIVVCWYDCRNDTNNRKTQCFGNISRNGGATFAGDFQICPGPSDANNLYPGWLFCYGDYLGIDYQNGFIQAFWADCSNGTNDNPDGIGAAMDLYSWRLGY